MKNGYYKILFLITVVLFQLACKSDDKGGKRNSLIKSKHVVKRKLSNKENQNRKWADRLEYVGVAVEEPNYHVWGSSPVVDAEGKTHLFVSRWPEQEGFKGWRTHCEIARYLSDTPEGPFIFQEVVLDGTEINTWDKKSPHNPNVQQVGNKYVLLYIANAGGKKEWVASQRIGMMIANHPKGPWKKVGDDGLILSPPESPKVWSYKSAVGVNNPALFAHPDGSFYLYYKAMKLGDVRRMGVAISKDIEGPYIFKEDYLTSNATEIEDEYAFLNEGKICLITTNNEEGAGYLWESEDGIHFKEPILGFDKMANYLPKDSLESAKILRGKKFERPQILMQNGKPTHLFVASGANFNGGTTSFSCVFRIKQMIE